MKKLKLRTIIIASLFLLVITGFRLIWLSYYHTDQPKAEQGVLDLTEWTEAENKTVQLDGEWEFFPDIFLTPKKASEKGDIIQVPGNWNEANNNNAYGYGTYRLKILVPKGDTNLLEIHAVSIRTASRLYINGHLHAENGIPSNDLNIHHGTAVPLTATLKADQNGEIELLFHVSNFDNFSAGGINKSIKFGDPFALNQELQTSATWQFVLFVFMLLHSLYALILFLLRPKRKGLLYFALGVFFFAISVVTDDSRLILKFFPLSYDEYYKVIKVSYIAGTGFLLLFIKHMFFEAKKPRSLSYLSGICLSSGLLTIFLPTKYLFFTTYHSALIFISFAAVVVLMYKFIVLEMKDVLLILLSAMSVLSSLVWGIVKAGAPSYFQIFYPFDLILAIILLSTFCFKRFFQEVEVKEQLYIKLQKEDKLKDEFLANTSHELRNPLHGIINIAESIADDKHSNVDETVNKKVDLLINISRRMSLMLNDLLDIGKIKKKGIELEIEHIKLETITYGVLDMFTFILEGKDIRFSVEIPPAFPYIAADKNRLIQIMYNLVHNAVKFTAEGTITIRAEKKNRMAYIHVIDPGVGIDAETIDQIFQPYEQGMATSVQGGIGLGLSICKQLIELHKGELKVSSILGEGSTFTFTLPLADDALEERNGQNDGQLIPSAHEQYTNLSLFIPSDKKQYTEMSTRPHSKRPKILAVDDDVINLQLLSHILPDSQYDLVTATTGKEVLNRLNSKEWDLIISDVMMPYMSGYELTRAIREHYSVSELPILLLTARDRSIDVYTGYLSGANDYVTKPIEGMELRARVDALTDLKHSIHEQLSMEAAWLQAQIQPHFLFNTLNTIASLSEIDTERMTALLEEFGNYLQMSFNPKNLRTAIPLDQELALVQSYIYIERERFGRRLSVECEVDEDIELFIPPLTIQPLVENAVRHGILKQIYGGHILIKIKVHGSHAEISIQDNGVGMNDKQLKQALSTSEKTGGIGLVNTNKRLVKMYGEGLNILSIPNRGTTVSFKVPIHSND